MTQGKYTTQEQIEAMHKEILHEKQKMAGVSTGKGSSGVRLSQRRKLVKTAGWVMFSALILLLVGSIISINMTKSRGEIPNVWGFHLFAIESGSMEPTLKVGAVIISRKLKDPEDLKAYDIVTFRTLSNAIVTHRIIEVVINDNDSKAYRTKGDNPKNTADLELLTPDRVIGVFAAKIPLT